MNIESQEFFKHVQKCTYCELPALHHAFDRYNRKFVRCKNCRAFLQIVSCSKSEETEYTIYESGDFCSSIQEELGDTPDYEKFEEFKWCLRKGSLLEIGPGSGHFLAAARDAGFKVFGIETSAYNRNYIAKKWHIETTSVLLEKDMLPPQTFDNIVSFNCLEHIINPSAHFASAFRALKPGGRFLISTCNADSIIAKIAGRWWTMFKPQDHVNIPSPESFRILGERTKFYLIRLWCSEYPLETPIGFLAAIHDWLIDILQRRKKNIERQSRLMNKSSKDKIEFNGSTMMPISAGRKFGRRLIKNKAFACIGGIISFFMLGSSIKVLYEKP